MRQDVVLSVNICISYYELDVVHEFVYLGSTIYGSLTLDMQLSKRIGKAATTI